MARHRSSPGEAFTPHAKAVLERAAEEARRVRHSYVGPEHIALALLREPHGSVWSMIRGLDLSAPAVIAEIERRCRPGRTPPGSGRLPLTSWAKKVLERSMTEARDRGDPGVEPAHLFLALLIATQRGKGPFAPGLDEARMRQAFEHAVAGRAGADPRSHLEVRIDDGSTLSIYEQLVAQVKESIATGAVRPGERLPTVRQLADHLDIAPGTVARAYAELERLGVVVTEGARGTRVADSERGLDAARRPETLVGLLRPVAVAAFHLGASATELRTALDHAMEGIFGRSNAA